MTTQRRNRGASRSNSPSPGIPGGTFVVGLVTGVILTLAFDAIIPDQSKPIEATPTETAAPASRPSSDFQFYTLLNEQEVAVSDSGIATAPETEETIYELQVSSFKNQADADRLRASLILLNLDAKISPVNVQGTLWHRVIVGPFHTRTDRASAQAVLIGNGYQQPLAIEKKQPLPPSP